MLPSTDPVPAYEAVIFDMDGVIIDSEPLHEKAQRVVFRQFGLDVPESAFLAFKGQSEDAVFEAVVERYATTPLDPRVLVTRKHEVYDGLQHELEPVDGALGLIERLAGAGMRLALTTSATPANQAYAFDRFGLTRFFQSIVTAADVTRAKPDPEPYLTTADRLGVPPGHCLVVEDSTHGVTAARRAGCTVVGLTTSFSRADLSAAGAHHTADTFAEVACYLF